MNNIPAIVVVAYNRPNSLKRLLDSISVANFSDHCKIPLIISIDNSNCTEVRKIAQQFDWPYGDKKVISQEVRLGLRKHILSCGDLSQEYGSVIVLEDDLFVSPEFYQYSVQAMKFFLTDEKIAGISLYSYNFNEHAGLGFFPMEDGYDNYFIQTPSSWGQLWTKRQWENFKKWLLSTSSVVEENDMLPDNIIAWPESSWKKYFAKYLVQENKYFAYPRISLSTNMGDAGSHWKQSTNNFQVPLLMRRKNYNFSTFGNSLSVYDSHYEIIPESLKILNPKLNGMDFDCDFYGTKQLRKVKATYLISLRESDKPIVSYGLGLLPQELNVAYNLPGEFFQLAKVVDMKNVILKKRLEQVFSFHKSQGLKIYGSLFAYNLWKRLRNSNK